MRNSSGDSKPSPCSCRPQFTLRALLATILAINILLGAAHPWIQTALRSHRGRLWQPSIRHSAGVVNHYDGNGNDICEGIDPQVYLWIITHNNGELLPATDDSTAANR